MKIVTLTAAPVRTKNLLTTLDLIRECVLAGEVVALAVCTIERDDTVTGYTSSVGGVTRLRMLGAMATLQQMYLNGELDGE